MTRRSFRKIISTILVTLLCMHSGFAESNTLRVLAYNIHHARGMDGKVDVERIAKVIEEQNPDLVALQEVDKNCRRSGKINIAAELASLLKMEYRFGRAIDLQGGEYGNAVLSKLPILSTHVHPLKDSKEPRVLLEVVVEQDGSPLSFVSLHLERGSGDERTKQAQALLNIFNSKKHPVILAGDFNAARWAEPMKLIEDSGWKIIEKNDGNDIRTFHGEKKKKDSATTARVEIDYIVTRGLAFKKLIHGVVPELIASDHRPIYAQFWINE